MGKEVTPAYVLQAEEDLIGDAMLDVATFHEANLTPSMFYKPQHRLIWEAITKAAEQTDTLDPTNIAATLGDKLDRVGGLAALGGLFAKAPGNSTGFEKAKLVRDNYLKRETLKALAETERDHYAGYNGAQVYERMMDRMGALADIQTVVRPNMRQEIASELRAIRDDIAAGTCGTSGIPLDDLGLAKLVPTGLPTDKVTVIGGATGNFKTTLGFNLMDTIAKVGPVLLLTLEDSSELTRQCAISRLTGIPYGRIINRDLTSREVDDISQTIGNEKTRWLDNIITVGDFHPSVDEVIRLARQYKRSHGILGVILDYVQLLDVGSDNQAFGIAAAAKKMQLAAHRDSLAYVVLSQVNVAKLVARRDHRPQLSDLFGSSGLAQSCKLCLTTYKPSRVWANPEDALTDDNKTQYTWLDKQYTEMAPETYDSHLEVWVRKNRAGAIDKHVGLHVGLTTGKVRPI